MRIAKFVPVLSAFLVLTVVSGCRSAASPKGGFAPKTEEELDAMESRDRQANDFFQSAKYNAADGELKKLLADRTVSSPLYEMERVSILLMQGKDDEAHALMMRIQNEIETLYDTKLEKKAQSLWHGEQNKVFKGDPYERATLYAFLAMSFLCRGNCADALRCVKNGLLADSDVEKAQYTSDYALLQYLGYLSCIGLERPDDAAAYRREMVKSLMLRKVPLASKAVLEKSCFSVLKDDAPNTLLVLWVGRPPEFVRGGEYGEIRHPIPGPYPFDVVTVAVGAEPALIAPPELGDVNFQAVTRGGRMMDQVLADKAMVKKSAELSRNVFLTVGAALILAGANDFGVVGISLMSAGGGCLVIGGTAHIIGSMVNPAADVRYWKNLPNRLLVIPMRLPPGRSDVFVTGFAKADATAFSAFSVTVDPKKALNVFHLQLSSQGEDGPARIKAIFGWLGTRAAVCADAEPMSKEFSVK